MGWGRREAKRDRDRVVGGVGVGDWEEGLEKTVVMTDSAGVQTASQRGQGPAEMGSPHGEGAARRWGGQRRWGTRERETEPPERTVIESVCLRASPDLGSNPIFCPILPMCHAQDL